MVLLLQTIVTPRCAWTRWSMPLFCMSCCFPKSFTSLSWRKVSLPWSCGPWQILQLHVDEVFDVLVFTGGVSSTGAVVVKTVVLPQLHLS